MPRQRLPLDVYAGLFADSLDEVADRLDQAFANLTSHRRLWLIHPSKQPFEQSPHSGGDLAADEAG